MSSPLVVSSAHITTNNIALAHGDYLIYCALILVFGTTRAVFDLTIFSLKEPVEVSTLRTAIIESVQFLGDDNRLATQSFLQFPR